MAGTSKGHLSGWFYASLGVISIYLLLLVIKWQALPVFIDIYYHSSCMTGFRDAGGIVLWDFWEHAPSGRPHLYPPLFHIVMLALNNLGLTPLAVMRSVSIAIYPALLFSLLWVLRKLYNDRLAFFTVLAAASSYTFFLNVLTAIPSSIGLIMLIFIFYAIERKNILAGGLLLGLLFYTHGGIPWIAVSAAFIYGIFKRDKLRMILAIILIGMALGSPWLIHMIRSRGYFLAVSNYINNYYEANLILYALAFFGMLIAVKRKGRELFYFAILASMLPLAKDYTFRFFCGEGILPFVLFAGLALDDLYGSMTGYMKGRVRPVLNRVLLPWMIFYIMTLLTPVVSWNGERFSFEVKGSVFSRFTGRDPAKISPMGATIYTKKYMEEIFEAINANSRPDELIYSNYGYLAGLFYTFCGRATTCTMLNEVRPFYYSNPAINAALFVWMKNPEGYVEPELIFLIKRLGLTRVAETEFAYIYRNPVVIAHKTIARAVVPSAAAFFILGVWLWMIIWSFIRR